MVISLGPGKFYGSSLPRPYIYTDVKYNSERVDPPAPFTDSLLSWANEAHWSMGGLSFKRLRLQGRIEGNIKKLKAEKERMVRRNRIKKNPSGVKGSDDREDSVSPPPAPVANKRKRFIIEEDDDEQEEEVVVKEKMKKKVGRKLKDDFDRVANEDIRVRKESPRSDDGLMFVQKMKKASESLISMRTRTGKRGNVDEEEVKGKRSSPRLSKR